MNINGSVVEFDDGGVIVIPKVSAIHPGASNEYFLYSESGWVRTIRSDDDKQKLIRAINSWYNDRRPIDHETTMVRKF